MTFERPSSGNPYQLTVNQHIFPARSIERFYGIAGMVQVFNKQTGKMFPSVARNPIFCAQRAWHQKAESGFMLEIESRFQPIAHAIVTGTLRYVTPFEHDVISRMYALWLCRFARQDNSQPDPVMKMVRPERELTQVDQEKLEKAGILMVRPDSSVPMRQIIGVRLQLEVEDLAHQLTGGCWGILRADEGEFLVPDNFGSAPIIPLSPKIVLAYGDGNTALDSEGVVRINQLAWICSRRYIFARNWKDASLIIEKKR
jgi:hypothetical protein